MTAIKSIKSMMTMRSSKSQQNSASEITKKKSLKDAITAASLKQDTADHIEALAIAEEIENQMARDIAREINIEFNLGFDKDKLDSADDAEQSKIINTLTEENSERILELQRKQLDMQGIHQQVQQSSTMLETLVKQSEQMSKYLSKTEIEISRLEDVETRYTNLYSASELLAKEHRELKSKLEEKYKQVNLLEGQKHKNRDMLDKAQLEINRLVEENNSQTADMHTQEILVSKLRDENLSVIEKNNILTLNLAELNKLNDELQDKLKASHNELAESEKTISKNNLKIDTLTKENEQTAIDSLDIKARYTSLNDKYADAKSRLEEAKYELSSERASFDEKLRLKDARIMKMERKIEVLTRQVSLTEQMVTDITDDKTVKLSNKLKEMKQPYCKSPGVKTKPNIHAAGEAVAAQ